MMFNPYLTKQIQEIIFSHRTTKANYPGLMFDNNLVRIILDSKVTFDKNLKTLLSKITKFIVLLPISQVILHNMLANNLQII